jgi:hypothetical protein
VRKCRARPADDGGKRTIKSGGGAVRPEPILDDVLLNWQYSDRSTSLSGVSVILSSIFANVGDDRPIGPGQNASL